MSAGSTNTGVATTSTLLKVTAIKASGLPGVGWPKRPGNYYVTVSIDGISHKTGTTVGDDAPMWNETFSFNVHEPSTLKLVVFAKRTMVSDDYVGEIEGSVGSLLAKGIGGAVSCPLSRQGSNSVPHTALPTVQFVLTENEHQGGHNSIGDKWFGLHVLAPGVDPVVDVIAIHGLDGHPEKSWTAENGILWLRDLLPQKVPRASVLAYGYDANTRGKKLADKSIYDLARDLMSSLASERQATGTGRRPIIFVTHSLGGIVLKYVGCSCYCTHGVILSGPYPW